MKKDAKDHLVRIAAAAKEADPFLDGAAMVKEYYRVMGLTNEATADEVKKTYRRLAMEFHPDRRWGETGSSPDFRSGQGEE